MKKNFIFNITQFTEKQMIRRNTEKSMKKNCLKWYNISKNSLPLQCFNKQLIVLQI